MIKIGNTPSPEQFRIDLMHARNAERLNKVFAMAAGEVKRMTGITLRPGVAVDELALNKGLAGQPVERRLRVKSMLFELGMISA
jgi:hypothetical protein